MHCFERVEEGKRVEAGKLYRVAAINMKSDKCMDLKAGLRKITL